jgi:type I restriction-modification system DNA methylase subunit
LDVAVGKKEVGKKEVGKRVATNNEIEKRLWAAADQLWANASLRPSEFSGPVLGLIFLRYAENSSR